METVQSHYFESCNGPIRGRSPKQCEEFNAGCGAKWSPHTEVNRASSAKFMSMHLMNRCLIGVHLMGVHLMSIYLIGMHFIGVHLPYSRRLTGVAKPGTSTNEL
jgi:hypothetical protein